MVRERVVIGIPNPMKSPSFQITTFFLAGSVKELGQFRSYLTNIKELNSSEKIQATMRKT